MPKKLTKSSLIKKLDKVFADVVKMIGKCEWCKATDKALQCAHIYSRRYRHTRWDSCNAIALCISCHFRAHQRPLDFAKFIEEYLGEGTIATLREKSLSIEPVTLQTMLETYRSLLEVRKRG